MQSAKLNHALLIQNGTIAGKHINADINYIFNHI